MSRAFQVAQQRTFSKQADYNAFCVVRVPNARVAELGGRGAWVALTGSRGKTLYRTVRGSGDIRPFPPDAIELDYDTGQQLGISPAAPNPSGFYPGTLTIRRAHGFEVILAHWRQPDPAYRVPLQLSLVSLVLGLVGLVLGVVSLV